MTTNTINTAVSNIENMPTKKKELIRHLLPLTSTVGTLLWSTLGFIPVFAVIGILLILFGFICAITICPGKMIKLPLIIGRAGFKIVRGFIPYYGIGDICGGIFGFLFGVLFGCMILFVVPAAFTIHQWFHRDDLDEE